MKLAVEMKKTLWYYTLSTRNTKIGHTNLEERRQSNSENCSRVTVQSSISKVFTAILKSMIESNYSRKPLNTINQYNSAPQTIRLSEVLNILQEFNTLRDVTKIINELYTVTEIRYHIRIKAGQGNLSRNLFNLVLDQLISEVKSKNVAYILIKDVIKCDNIC